MPGVNSTSAKNTYTPGGAVFPLKLPFQPADRSLVWKSTFSKTNSPQRVKIASRATVRGSLLKMVKTLFRISGDSGEMALGVKHWARLQ
jgi:hypothetical protein